MEQVWRGVASESLYSKLVEGTGGVKKVCLIFCPASISFPQSGPIAKAVLCGAACRMMVSVENQHQRPGLTGSLLNSAF